MTTTAPTALTVVLPLPHKALSPNSRGHWAVKAKAVKKARADAYAATIAVMREGGPRGFMIVPPAKANVRATFYKRTKAHADTDNAAASLKAYLDGMADAGIVANDSQFILHAPTLLVDKANPRVEIVIEPHRENEP